MGVKDGDAREHLLEDWAAAQQRKNQPAAPEPSRARRLATRVGHRLAARSQLLADRVFDRGLHTAGATNEPEHDHPDRVRYVPSDWHVLPRALRYLGVSGSDTFVDF